MLQENYHLGVFFESLRTDERINIFSGLHRELVTDIRELMIHMVLHTDMSGHFVALKVSLTRLLHASYTYVGPLCRAQGVCLRRHRARAACARAVRGEGGERESKRDCVCAIDTHKMTYSDLFQLVFVDT